MKQITPSNLLEPDGFMARLKNINEAGDLVPIRIHDYINSFNFENLDKDVPGHLVDLFEVARGAMIYGYFFYPLFALAAEQLFRVAEASVKQVCKDLNAPKSKRSFISRLDWLERIGIISESKCKKWLSTRRMRNEASHPDIQMLIPPGIAINVMKSIISDTNALFRQKREYLCKHKENYSGNTQVSDNNG